MRKLGGFLILLLVMYAIYNDLSAGTLPAATSTAQNIAKESKQPKVAATAIEIPYFEHEVNPGDTVLSVLDRNSKLPLEVPISKAIADFKVLNDGIDPQKIKFGNSYKFPDYSSID
jgi:hypothetical protein